MSTINEDTKKYLENFREKQFTEYNFVALLLHLLYQNGIYKIDESQLERKLYYYMKNLNFRELFQDIIMENLPGYKSADLYNGFYRAKYFGGGIWFEQNNCDVLNLAFEDDIDLSLFEQGLSEDGKIKIRQMAGELAVRYKKEEKSKITLDIYGTNPNCHYELVHGLHHGGLYSSELITDGDILKINYPDIRELENVYWGNPINPKEAFRLENNKIAYVTIQNATYAVKQGLYNRKIYYGEVKTETLDMKDLEDIVNIANTYHTKNEQEPTTEAPYVRKLVLK